MAVKPKARSRMNLQHSSNQNRNNVGCRPKKESKAKATTAPSTTRRMPRIRLLGKNDTSTSSSSSGALLEPFPTRREGGAGAGLKSVVTGVGNAVLTAHKTLTPMRPRLCDCTNKRNNDHVQSKPDKPNDPSTQKEESTKAHNKSSNSSSRMALMTRMVSSKMRQPEKPTRNTEGEMTIMDIAMAAGSDPIDSFSSLKSTSTFSSYDNNNDRTPSPSPPSARLNRHSTPADMDTTSFRKLQEDLRASNMLTGVGAHQVLRAHMSESRVKSVKEDIRRDPSFQWGNDKDDSDGDWNGNSTGGKDSTKVAVMLKPFNQFKNNVQDNVNKKMEGIRQLRQQVLRNDQGRT